MGGAADEIAVERSSVHAAVRETGGTLSDAKNELPSSTSTALDSSHAETCDAPESTGVPATAASNGHNVPAVSFTSSPVPGSPASARTTHGDSHGMSVTTASDCREAPTV